MKSCFSVFGENISFEYFARDGLCEHLSCDHCHDKYEITYLISASGSCLVEGQEINLTDGTFTLITPMSYHKVSFDDEKNTEGYTIYFSRGAMPEGIASVLDAILSDTSSFGLVYSRKKLSDTLISVFDRFEEAKKLSKTERQIYMQALLSEIIILLSACEGEAIEACEDELGAKVAAYINSNIERSISLERLARRFFVSKYYLCRAFKSYAGISPHAYINHKRILHAKRLIESGLTAAGAAERVGFGDYSAFYRAYTKIVGKSPTSE